MDRRALALAVCTMCVIWYLSGRPGGSFSLPGGWDKPVHAVEYALLGYLLARGLGGRRRGILGFMLAAAYGALDEYHQSFVAGRESSAADFMADAAGAAAGAAAAILRADGRKRDTAGDLP